MLAGLIGTLALACHVAGIAAAIHAVMHVRTPQGAIGWMLALIFVPYLALPPYLFLGSSHFHGYTQVQRLRSRQTRPAPWPGRGEYLAKHPPRPECARYRAIGRMLGARFHGGHRLRLLIDGAATFAALFDAIGQAERQVLVQFFIIHDDALGRRLQQVLLERAAAGVHVCVLYDSIGSHALPRHYVDTLRRGGVDIRPFATRRWRNRFQLNFRNHRKIVVVDGWRGFLGGLNVGDEYLGLKPPLSPWRDTHLEVQGPAVADLQRSFARDWRWATGEEAPFMPPRAGPGTASVLTVATGPADPQESGSLFFVEAIHAARRRVWLTTPYFVPDQAVLAALRLAVLRGVDVRILLPARPDHRMVFLASTLRAHEAIRAGVRLYRYQPGFLHQKVLLIDEDTAAVGSMNLDSRSFRLNFEITALAVDRAFAGEVEAMLAADFARSRAVDLAEYRHAPFLRRLAMHLVWLLEPVL
ncbi:MAG: cardiolipin synthase [Fulvimonas sp.]|nr:cardiolipin synthase [Fulvimonas sp.]